MSVGDEDNTQIRERRMAKRKLKNKKTQFLSSSNRRIVRALSQFGSAIQSSAEAKFIRQGDQVIHVWYGSDTLCRMTYNGGCDLSRYAPVSYEHGDPLCKNCLRQSQEQGIRLS